MAEPKKPETKKPTVDPTKEATHVGSPAKAFNEAFKLEGLGDETPDYLNMVIYGTPGAGKTTLAASAADVGEMSDVLLIDIESGRLSVKQNKRIKHKERIDSIRINSFRQLSEVHKFLKAHCRLRDMPDATDRLIQLEARFRGVDPASIKNPRRYSTVIIDSLTELDQICTYELMGFSIDMELDAALNDGDMEVADWPVFRKNNQMMQLIVRAYRDLPVSALFVCHQQYTQDEVKRFHYTPALTGKLASQVQGFVDVVGYLAVGQLKDGDVEAPRRLYVAPVGKWDAKNRNASYNKAFVDNPVMADLWNMLNTKL